MNALSSNNLTAVNTNLWTCQVCGRKRACPYAPLHFVSAVEYSGCGLCGDVCLSESSDRTGAQSGTVVNGGDAPKIGATDFQSLTPLAAYESKYGYHAAQGCFIESIWVLLGDEPSDTTLTVRR